MASLHADRGQQPAQFSRCKQPARVENHESSDGCGAARQDQAERQQCSAADLLLPGQACLPSHWQGGNPIVVLNACQNIKTFLSNLFDSVIVSREESGGSLIRKYAMMRSGRF